MQGYTHYKKNQPQDHPPTLYGGYCSQICYSHKIQYLGVTICEDLRWNRHVAEITCWANRLFGLLRQNLSARDRKIKEAVYLGLVRPLLEYASQAWDPYTSNLLDEIEIVQRRAARFVLTDYKSYEPGSVIGLLS